MTYRPELVVRLRVASERLTLRYLKPVSTASVTITASGAEALGETVRPDDVRTGRDACENSLLAREPDRHHDRLVVFDRFDVVDLIGVTGSARSAAAAAAAGGCCCFTANSASDPTSGLR
jgi:hypothetical protein